MASRDITTADRRVWPWWTAAAVGLWAWGAAQGAATQGDATLSTRNVGAFGFVLTTVAAVVVATRYRRNPCPCCGTPLRRTKFRIARIGLELAALGPILRRAEQACRADGSAAADDLSDFIPRAKTLTIDVLDAAHGDGHSPSRSDVNAVRRVARESARLLRHHPTERPWLTTYLAEIPDGERRSLRRLQI